MLLKFAKLMEREPPRARGAREPRQRQADPRMPDGRRAGHDPHHPLACRTDRQDLRQHRAGRDSTRLRWSCASRSASSACVLPWNFPLLMLAWKIGPALASGCSVIVKPAEQTSLTTLRVAELAHRGGHAGGRLQRRHRHRQGRRRADRPAHGRRDGELHRLDARPGGASCATRRTPTSSASCWNAAARTRRWCWTTPRTSTSSPSRWSTARSGTWARTARPPRG